MALGLNLPSVASAQSNAQSIITPTRSEELRGVWLTNVDSDVLFSRDKLEAGIQQLAELHFNTIYPTVWNGGYTLYPSQVAEKWIGEAVDPIPEFEDRDMLAEAIEIAHEQGLAVIPWYEFGLMALEESDIPRRHPEWIMSRKDGSQVFVHGDQGQHRFVWLNPAHPEVQDLMANLMVEVVTKYDIDGIQFDDHFGTPVELGYDDYTVRLYQQEHNGRQPPENPQDAEWMRWRASKVTTMMVKIFSAIKTRKPDCLISLSPNPQEFSYENYLQDWAPWLRLGFIDELIIQVYRTDMNQFITEIDRPELRVMRRRIPISIGILTGLRVLNVETQQIEEQVKLTRDREFAGFSFFFYETLRDRSPTFEALFPQPASRPNFRNYAAGL
ncbi:MAG: glycoside hydrolase family 10 protein [Elainellaceae cyanobacterium]